MYIIKRKFKCLEWIWLLFHLAKWKNVYFMSSALMKYTFFHFMWWNKSHIHSKHLNILYVIHVPLCFTIWATEWENVPSGMCAQRRLKTSCASAQSDQSLRCPHEEILHPWLSKKCPVRIMIEPREYATWSESEKGHFLIEIYFLHFHFFSFFFFFFFFFFFVSTKTHIVVF